jgi:hypothetical protein
MVANKGMMVAFERGGYNETEQNKKAFFKSFDYW